MSRRTIFTVSFLVFVTAIVWYASSMIRIDELSFNQAAQVGDHKKKVMVATKVVKDKEISSQGEAAVTFFAIDREGTESKVLFEGSDKLTAGQLSNAAEKGAEISIAGHMCGDQFKATNVYLPAY
jgi:hypothetical protein